MDDYDREEEEVEQLHACGKLSDEEYNERMRDLERGRRDAFLAEVEEAHDAIDRHYGLIK